MGADLIVATLWRRRAVFLLTFLAFSASVLIVTSRLPAVYSSKGYLWVSSGRSDASDYEATQTNLVLSKTYAELLGSELVAEEVAKRLPFSASGTAVKGAVAVAPVAQSQLIRVRAEASSKERARTLTDVYLTTAVERAAELSRLHDDTDVVTLAQPADLPAQPVRPKPLLYLLVGNILGAALAFAVAMLRDRLDTTVRPSADVSELFGVPILARVARSRRRILALGRRKTSADEERDAALQVALVNLTLLNGRTRPASIAVTTATPQEDGTTWAHALAQAGSAAGLQVILVERVTGPARSSRDSAVETGERPSETVEGSAVHIVSSQELKPAISLLGGENEVTRLEREVAEEYDLRVYDAGALFTTPDAAILAAASEATVLVVESRWTDASSLQRALERLKAVHASVVGIMLVNADASAPYSAQWAGRDGRADVGDGRRRPKTTDEALERDRGPARPGENAPTVTVLHDPPMFFPKPINGTGTA